MDGKVGAEELLGRALGNPGFLKSLAGAAEPADASSTDAAPTR